MRQHIKEYDSTSIKIPAYSGEGDGLTVELTITAYPSGSQSVSASGNIACALKENFRRVIGIMSSINSSWEKIENFDYHLDSSNDCFLVKDSKSSSMAISIALFNLYRVLCGKSTVSGLTGTGILRIDGSFENAHFETEKATISNGFFFVSPSICRNLFVLESLMNQYHKRS